MASPIRRAKIPVAEPTEQQPQNAVVLPLPFPPQPSERESEARVPAERIGIILRRERERRGDDLQQIADYLCIRKGFLVALEAGRYDEFPVDAYVIGFLRSYAEFLGLKGQEAIDYYRHEMAGRRNKPSLMMPTPISEGRTPSAFILIGATIAALVIYALWYGLSSSDRAVVVAPPSLTSTTISDNHSSEAATIAPAQSLPETAAPTTTPTVNQSEPPTAIALAAPAPAPIQMPAPTVAPPSTASQPQQPAGNPVAAPLPQPTPLTISATHIVVKADQASWVLITDAKGHTVFDRVLRSGETYDVPDTRGLNLTTGNGSGITITLNGVELQKLSTAPSHVVRNIPLNAATLKTLLPQTSE